VTTAKTKAKAAEANVRPLPHFIEELLTSQAKIRAKMASLQRFHTLSRNP
jgi:hypothetical protein